MKSLDKFILFIKWSTLVLCFSVSVTVSFAAVDITERVLIKKSRLQYEPDTQTSYMDVSVKNASKNIVPSPIKVVIEDISNPSVTASNPDGKIGGKPYFEYTAYGGVLSAGEQTEQKRWEFSNPKEHPFTLRLSSHFSDETSDIYWRTSTPEAQGFDSATLLQILKDIKDNNRDVHSILLIRNGRLVLESYQFPYNRDTQQHTASVTKSVLSALTGIALEQGYISLDQTVNDYFSQYLTDEMDPRKRQITLHHLLTMTTGLDLNDNNLNTAPIWQSDNWVKNTLAAPMTHAPGETFNYSSLGSHLMGVIVQQATGMSLLELGNQHLFGPLGIENVQFLKDPAGYDVGSGGHYWTPQDMAKFGSLFLNNGVWEGNPILSEHWVETSTSNQIGDLDASHNTAQNKKYGYQWWVLGDGFYEAFGLGGQTILLNNDLDLAVVITQAGPDAALIESVVGALQDIDALPENPEALEALNKTRHELKYPKATRVPPLPQTAQQISGQTFPLDDGTTVTFDFLSQKNTCLITEAMPSGPIESIVGLDGVWRFSERGTPPNTVRIASRGNWTNPDTFVWDFHPVGGTTYHTVTYQFTASGIQVTADCRPSDVCSN